MVGTSFTAWRLSLSEVSGEVSVQGEYGSLNHMGLDVVQPLCSWVHGAGGRCRH